MITLMHSAFRTALFLLAFIHFLNIFLDSACRNDCELLALHLGNMHTNHVNMFLKYLVDVYKLLSKFCPRFEWNNYIYRHGDNKDIFVTIVRSFPQVFKS